MFAFLGFSPEEAKAQFGFLVNGLLFNMGAPTTTAFKLLGLDRLVGIFLGRIKETSEILIAFPKKTIN